MPIDAGLDVATAARRLRHKVVLALALCSVVPFLVLLYVVQQSPALADDVAVRLLLLATLLGVVVGGWLIWRIGRTVSTAIERIVQAPGTAPLPTATDEVGALVGNVAKMFQTIEQQANEINRFTARLDAAYRELESTNARLKETSFKDDLTGLYNRRFFTIRLEEEISRHRRFNHPVSVVLVDLDGFKAVNDELGHAVGDETLRDVAQLLMKHSRGINVVSRYGGDEFAILLVETSKAGALLYADRIRDVVARFRFSHGKPVTASLGVASLPDDDVTSSETLFKAADEALYAAKRAGKNQVGILDPAREQTP